MTQNEVKNIKTMAQLAEYMNTRYPVWGEKWGDEDEEWEADVKAVCEANGWQQLHGWMTCFSSDYDCDEDDFATDHINALHIDYDTNSWIVTPAVKMKIKIGQETYYATEDGIYYYIRHNGTEKKVERNGDPIKVAALRMYIEDVVYNVDSLGSLADALNAIEKLHIDMITDYIEYSDMISDVCEKNKWVYTNDSELMYEDEDWVTDGEHRLFYGDKFCYWFLFDDIVKEVEYNDTVVDVHEDYDNYYIDFRTGAGEATYPKEDWDLKKALADQANLDKE